MQRRLDVERGTETVGKGVRTKGRGRSWLEEGKPGSQLPISSCFYGVVESWALHGAEFSQQPADVEWSRPWTGSSPLKRSTQGRSGRGIDAQKRPSSTLPPLPRRRRFAATNWTTSPAWIHSVAQRFRWNPRLYQRRVTNSPRFHRSSGASRLFVSPSDLLASSEPLACVFASVSCSSTGSARIVRVHTVQFIATVGTIPLYA